jgi:hypothetical protein
VLAWWLATLAVGLPRNGVRVRLRGSAHQARNFFRRLGRFPPWGGKSRPASSAGGGLARVTFWAFGDSLYVPVSARTSMSSGAGAPGSSIRHAGGARGLAADDGRRCSAPALRRRPQKPWYAPADDSPPTPDADPPPATGGSRAPMGRAPARPGRPSGVGAPRHAVFVEGDFNAWSPTPTRWRRWPAVFRGHGGQRGRRVPTTATCCRHPRARSCAGIRARSRSRPICPTRWSTIRSFAWTDQAFHPRPKRRR